MTDYIVILCTTNSKDNAEIIAQNLLEKNLAACINISENIFSMYKWENKIQKESEVLLIIKSKQNLFTCVEEEIRRLHPYEVPEIISLDVVQGAEKYLEWINCNIG